MRIVSVGACNVNDLVTSMGGTVSKPCEWISEAWWAQGMAHCTPEEGQSWGALTAEVYTKMKAKWEELEGSPGTAELGTRFAALRTRFLDTVQTEGPGENFWMQIQYSMIPWITEAHQLTCDIENALAGSTPSPTPEPSESPKSSKDNRFQTSLMVGAAVATLIFLVARAS